MKKHLRLMILILTGISLVGCSSQRDKAARILLQTLEDRYEEEFVIDSMGNSWGTFDDSTIKAWVYPKDNEDHIFKAQIKKDFSRVDDQYMNLTMANKVTDALTSLLEPITDDEFELLIKLDAGMIANGTKQMTLETFLSEEMHAIFVVELFIKSKGPLNEEMELTALKKFVNAYNKTLKKETMINVYYLKDTIFDELEKNLKTTDNVYKYYSDVNHCYQFIELDFPLQAEDLTLELFRD